MTEVANIIVDVERKMMAWFLYLVKKFSANVVTVLLEFQQELRKKKIIIIWDVEEQEVIKDDMLFVIIRKLLRRVI